MHMGKDLTEERSKHKETHAGHVGLEQHEQTSLRGIAKRAVMPDAEPPKVAKMGYTHLTNGFFLVECPLL